MKYIINENFYYMKSFSGPPCACDPIGLHGVGEERGGGGEEGRGQGGGGVRGLWSDHSPRSDPT